VERRLAASAPLWAGSRSGPCPYTGEEGSGSGWVWFAFISVVDGWLREDSWQGIIYRRLQVPNLSFALARVGRGLRVEEVEHTGAVVVEQHRVLVGVSGALGEDGGLTPRLALWRQRSKDNGAARGLCGDGSGSGVGSG
jgi:hypothetical protein